MYNKLPGRTLLTHNQLTMSSLSPQHAAAGRVRIYRQALVDGCVADVAVEGRRIVAVEEEFDAGHAPEGSVWVDAEGKVLAAGLIDLLPASGGDGLARGVTTTVEVVPASAVKVGC